MSFSRAKAMLAGTRFADVRWVSSTGSTNRDMVDLLADPTGDPTSPVVLLADHQTAGRGRLDRTWAAPEGASILMTVGLPVGGFPPERRTLLTSALAVSVIGAASVEGALSIKWPNDLVAVGVGDDGGDRKVGGILAELHHVSGPVGDAVMLGIGLNVNWTDLPDELVGVAESLRRLLGHSVDRDDLVAEMLTSLDRDWLPVLEDTHRSPQALQDAYRAASATLGRSVRVEMADAVLFGTALDVTSTGELVVVDDQQVERIISVGDVVHLRPAE